MQILSDIINVIETMKKRRHFREMLKMYTKQNFYCGWERWLQFELIQALYESEYVPAAEQSFLVDKRSNKYKNINRLDILCRKNKHATNYKVGIELKVSTYPSYSVGGIIRDLRNINHIVGSEWNLRGIVGIAIYSEERTSELRDSKYKRFIDCVINDETATSIKIEGWDFLLLGWESKSLKESSKQIYAEYFNSILECANHHSIL